MTERERLIKALGQERWLHLLAIADACEEEGRQNEACAWRHIVKLKRFPRESKHKAYWGRAGNNSLHWRIAERVGRTFNSVGEAYQALVRVLVEDMEAGKPPGYGL